MTRSPTPDQDVLLEMGTGLPSGLFHDGLQNVDAIPEEGDAHQGHPGDSQEEHHASYLVLG
jgi:hypothetical protein